MSAGKDEPSDEKFPPDCDIASDEDPGSLASSSASETMTGTAAREGSGTNSPRQPYIPPSPPKFVSFDHLMSAAHGVSNMSLAHEIAVNSEFKIEDVSGDNTGIQKQVKEIVHKAFWDSLEEKLAEDPPDPSGLVVLLAEIKETLLQLLLPDQHQRLQSHLTEVLDLDLIQQKLQHEALDINYYSDFVISIMARLCAPVRDEEVAKLREVEGGIIPLFKQIFAVLDMMKMDMANFTIQQMRPYIQQQSVDFERKKFQDFIAVQEEMGVDGLEFTRAWLSRNLGRLASDPSPSSTGPQSSTSQSSMGLQSTAPGPSSESQNKLTPATVLNKAYVELLDWEDDLQAYPETLLMDRERFTKLRDVTRHVCLLSTLLLVTYNIVGEAIVGITGFKNQLKTEISVLLDGVYESDLSMKLVHIAEHVVKQVNEVLLKHNHSVLSDVQVQALTQQYPAALKTDHPVHKIMRSRVFDFIQSLLTHGCKSPAKIPSGLSAMEKELSFVSGQFLRLVTHNRSVFGLYYGDIIGALLRKSSSS